MNLIECGKIVNTHSVYGELKIQPWSDTDDFLCDFDFLYIEKKKYEIERARVHKSCVLVKLAGIDSINDAIPFKNKTVFVDREDIELPENTYFIKDLVGLHVSDADGKPLGRLCEVLTLPAQDVYVIRGEDEYMIPAVPEFILDVSVENGTMLVKTIPGMKTERSVPENAD